MVEVKNGCDNCVHKPVCKYTEQFQKSMVDIVKVANNHFEAYDFNGFVDLSIRCRQYVMAPYREVKVKNRDAIDSLSYNFDPLYHADLVKMQEKSCNIMKKEEL